jgi:hypothetical protein
LSDGELHVIYTGSTQPGVVTVVSIEDRTAAETARDQAQAAAEQAQAAAGTFTAPADSVIATLVDDEESATGLAVRSAAGFSSQVGLLATSYGVVGDGVADDAAAVATLLAAAVAAGVPAIFEPGSTVRVQTPILPPSGVRMNLNGATILSRVPGGNGYTISMVGKSDVEIWGGTIDGDKPWYTAATEWRHGINIDNGHDIYLHDLKVIRHKGDGIYVGGTVSPTYSSNITLFNVLCDDNYRQGMSVIAVDGLTATSCQFTNTVGTAPQSGVDIEPNHAWQLCANVKFTACTFTGNAGNGYLVALVDTRTERQEGGTLIGCALDDNTEAGVRLAESQDFQMMGGSLSRNYQGLLHNSKIARNTKISGVEVRSNEQHGVAVSTGYSDLLITGCTFEANGAATTGDGLNIAPSTSSSNLRFIGNYSGQTPQRNGITLGANATPTMFVGNTYGGNTGASRSGESAITLDLDSAGKKTVTGSRGGNAALTSLLTGLATLGLITNSTSA